MGSRNPKQAGIQTQPVKSSPSEGFLHICKTLVPGQGKQSDFLGADAGVSVDIVTTTVERNIPRKVLQESLPLGWLVERREIREHLHEVGSGFQAAQRRISTSNLFDLGLEGQGSPRLVSVAKHDRGLDNPATDVHRRTGVISLEFAELPLAGEHPQGVVHTEAERIRDVSPARAGLQRPAELGLVLVLQELAPFEVMLYEI